MEDGLLPQTFVFFVRFNTFPDLMILSKSKLPFWLTGENVSKVKCPLFRNDLVGGGIPKLVGGDTARPALGMLRGCDGVAISAMVPRFNL